MMILLSIGLLRLCRGSWRSPKLVAVLFVGLTLVFGGNLKNLRYLFSAQDMVGEGIPAADELPALKQRYEEGPSSVLLVLPPEGRFSFSIPELCAMRKWYSLVRSSLPQLKSATSTFDLAEPMSFREGRSVKYQNVLQMDCDSQAVERSLQKTKEELDQAPWMAVRDSKDRLSFVFNFIYEESENSRFGNFDPGIVSHLRQTVETDLKKIVPDARIHWSGLADYQWYVKYGFRYALYINTVMVLFLTLALRLVYGTWMSALLFCGTLVLNGVWIYGGKALVGSPYDLLASGIFLILGMSGLEDFTFLSSEQLKGASWRQALRKIAVPALLTSLTTVVGFLSLCTSELAIIRRFGLWCAIGALIEWMMLFMLMPALLSVFFKKRTWVDPDRVVLGKKTQNWSAKAIPKWTSRIALLAIPLAIGLFYRLQVNDDPAKSFPQHHPYNQALKEIQNSKGFKGTVSLVLGENLEHEDAFQRLDAFADRLAKDPLSGVAGYETANQMLKWFNRQSYLPGYIAKFDFSQTSAYKQVVDSDEIPRATLYINDVSIQGLKRLEGQVHQICPNGECRLAGELIAYADFASRVPKTLIDSMVVSLVLVGLIIAFIAFAFNKQRLLPQLLASSFWGPFVMLLILVAFSIPMDFLKCIVFSILIGLTGDNAIQYLFAAGDSELSSGVENRGGASIHTCLFMAITALMYLGSYFNPPKVFGSLLAAGFILALVGDLWLLNGLLAQKRKPS